MTTRKKPTDYGQLAAQFGVVRRSWKRAAALSGLAVVVSEGLGIFTAMLFLDWLYQPQPMVRVGMWSLALAGLAFFLVRHVLKPLTRKISDEQIALYIEEHRADLDGVLITAAEFGKKRDQLAPGQAALIDSVVREATSRSAQSRATRVVDFSRLKKYGLIALAGIALYVLLSLAFPNTFAPRLARVLQPWHATEEDVARRTAAVLKAEPLRFTLSKEDTSLARGTSFDFDATLNKAKPAGSAVVLYFRPKAGAGEWQKIAMTEVEKLNTFHGTLPDISEDLEFYVACGEDKTKTFHLSVYDPLVVQSMETTIHYADYVKQPDKVEKPSTGDVTALVGSKVTLRIFTSTALKGGQITWTNGQKQPVVIDPQSPSVASVTFEAKEDGSYDYTLTDVNGQQAVSPASLTLRVIPDVPPTVVVKSPPSPLLTHPLGEVNFQVEANDDFGLEGVDLVYSRVDDQGAKETRIPLKLAPAQTKDSPNGVQASYRLALEDMQPQLKPNDTLAYHVEARDAKGQKTSSPIGFIIIGYFENWATFATPEITTGEVHDDTAPDLMALLSLVWELDNEKTRISADELKKRGDEIAAKMVDGSGNILNLVVAKGNPLLIKVTPLVTAHVKSSHDALVTHDTTKALAELTIAAAILAGNGVLEDTILHAPPEGQEMVAGSHYTPPALTMLEQARLNALAESAKDKTHQEDDKSKADAANAAAKQVEDLLKKQDAIVAKAQAMVNATQGGEGKKGDDKGAASGGGAKAADLAKDQHDLAEKTRAAADKAKAAAGGGAGAGAGAGKTDKAADKATAASKQMEEAARAFAAGKIAEGQLKAAQAKTTLQEAKDGLNENDRNKLEAAISNAERKASILLDKQRDLNTGTDAAAKDLGDKKPDQRQQRDLQKLAFQQAQLGADAEALNDEINSLNQMAAQGGQPEAVRALTDAQKIFKRNQPQTKMANAVIDLNNASPGTAGDEQKTAMTALQKIVDGLHASSDSLAASREAQLARAARAAQETKTSIEAVTGEKLPAPGAQAGTAPGTQAGTQPGTAPGTQAGTQPGKAPGTQAGTQPGTQPGQQPGTQPGTQAGTAPGTQPGTQAGTQPGTQPGPQPGKQGNASGGGGEDDIRKLAFNLSQLASVIDNRQLVPEDEATRLKEMTKDKAELEKKLAVDPKLLKDVTALVVSISGRIEAEIEAKTQASKLFTFQREECPPSYRPFVNKYFEAISQTTPASTQTPAPAANPGQP